MAQVHPTAVVHPGARLHETVEVGPYSVIGEKVTIGAGSRVGPHVVIEGRTRFAGATAATLSPALIDEFDLPEDVRGVLITRVEVGSLADNLGLRPGDIIINVNGEDLADAATFRDIVMRGANRWNLILMRGNTVMRSSVPG